MYCSKCGTQLPDGASFCSNCGFNLGSNPGYQGNPGYDRATASIMVNKKNEALALILSLIIPGLGEIYVGKTTKGILLILVDILVAALGLLFFFPFIVSLVIWIYAMYDSFTLAKYYNGYLLENQGQPPW